MSRFRVRVVCTRGGGQGLVPELRATTAESVDVGGLSARACVDDGVDCVVHVPGDRNRTKIRETLEAAFDCPVILSTDETPKERGRTIEGEISNGVRHVESDRALPVGRRSESATGANAGEILCADGGKEVDAIPERTDRLLERVTEGFFELDPKWNVTYANGAGLEMIDRSTEAVLGESLWDVLDEGEAATLRPEFEQAMKTQRPRTFEAFLDSLGLRVEVRVYPTEAGLSAFVREISDRTRAREEIEASEDALEQLHELASATDLGPLEKVERILDVGRERLGVSIGYLTRIEDGIQEIVESVGDHPELQPGSVAPLEEAYCRRTINREAPLAVDDAPTEGWANDPAYDRFGLESYLGSTLTVDGEQYGTVCFADTESRETPFTDAELTFIGLVTDWVSFVLTQQQYEDTLRSRSRQLSGILETSRSLMQARSREQVAELMAAATRDVLGYELNTVRLYDPDDESLVDVGTTRESEAVLGERPVYDLGEGMPGEVFVAGEPRIIDDLAEAGVGAGEARSAMYYPVGVHGTISVGSTETAAFDERDQQVLGLLATVAAAAATQAKREEEIREAREHVETILDRVNGIVETVVEVLVRATARDELEAGVVDELAAADQYAFAWLGRPDLASDTLAPTAWAGNATIPAEELEFPLDGDGAVARAIRTGELQIIDDVPSEEGDSICAGATACENVESAIVLPLSYKDTAYGVLAVFADEAGAFDERERVILGALGQAIANAINAVERGRILDADRVIEVEFAIDDPSLLCNRLSAKAGCRIESAGTDHRSDGTVKMYLTTEDGDGEELAALAADDGEVLDAALITDHENGSLLEVTVADSLVATLGEFGAVPTSVIAEDGQSRYTVELPYEAEARDFYDLLEERYPGTELVGYHEHERPIETRQEFRAALADRFTERQEMALRTAYLGGFFEWPREIDGNELAEAMAISRSTYHQHLRAAQKKVFEELFDQSV